MFSFRSLGNLVTVATLLMVSSSAFAASGGGGGGGGERRSRRRGGRSVIGRYRRRSIRSWQRSIESNRHRGISRNALARCSSAAVVTRYRKRPPNHYSRLRSGRDATTKRFCENQPSNRYRDTWHHGHSGRHFGQTVGGNLGSRTSSQYAGPHRV